MHILKLSNYILEIFLSELCNIKQLAKPQLPHALGVEEWLHYLWNPQDKRKRAPRRM
jgi:hypothetical protein